MILRSSSVLGLALSDRSIACVEVSVNGDRRTVRHMATLALPSELTTDNAAATGQSLAAFLRQQKISASRAVVGVPARWVIAMDRDVPPADEEATKAMLRLQAERLSASESGEMVFDYIGDGGKVLLVGIKRRKLEAIEKLLESARVSVAGVIPTSLALVCGLHAAHDQPMLVLARHGAEMVWQQHGTPRLLRHVAMQGAGTQDTLVLSALGSELRRTVALTPTNGSGPARELVLLDGVGLSEDQLAELTGRTGISVRNERGPELLGIQPGAVAANGASPAEFAPAMALALIGILERTLPLDFTNPRLKPPAVRRFSRQMTWSVIIGVVLIGLITSLYVTVQNRQAELARIEADIAGLTQPISGNVPPVKAAEQLLSRVNFARGYFDARPPVLECMREITRTLRPEDPIWVTSLTLKENGTGQLGGKASDQKSILALAGRLAENTRFANVLVKQMTEVTVPGGRSKEQSFTISFGFTRTE